MANGMDDYHVSFGVFSQGACVAEEHLVVDFPRLKNTNIYALPSCTFQGDFSFAGGNIQGYIVTGMEPFFFRVLRITGDALQSKDPLATLHSCMENPTTCRFFQFFLGRNCLELHFDVLMMIGNYINYINYMDKTVPIEKKKRICPSSLLCWRYTWGYLSSSFLGGTDWLWKKCSKCPARFERGTCAFGCPIKPDGLRRLGDGILLILLLDAS